MIAELGHFALALALVVALLQTVLPGAGARRAAAFSLCALCAAAFAALLACYALSDFSVLAVAQNSHAMMPLLYKITATWGNHEGSMLLWMFMLSLWGAAMAARPLSGGPQGLALRLHGALCLGFLAFILFTSSPFARLFPPAAEGAGFNPVLQDVALALHPPLLYAGYVGFSAAFCLALAALWEQKVDAAFAALLRPWVLAAFAALSAGITLGSLWAYYELGWGGFWFWDPVENAALLPWFAGAALLHSVTVLERRGALAGWVLFLAILAFVLSLLGAFIVRSGVLTSVHAFASDPARGVFILVLLSLAAGGAFSVYALRAPKLPPAPPFAPVSREGALLLNNIFLFTFCATVLTGTLYPVFMQALDLGAVAVGPPYYKATLLPLFVPFALLMGVGMAMPWGGAGRAVPEKLLLPAVLAVVTVIASGHYAPLSILGIGTGAWVFWAVICDAARKGRGMGLRYYGMCVAHAGFALLIIGVTASTQWAEEHIVWMTPGEHITLAGRDIAFLGTEQDVGPDYNADKGIFTLRAPGGTGRAGFLVPERRWYPVPRQETTEVALRFRRGGLLYLVLGAKDEGNIEKRVVRARYHPLVLLVFAGGFLVALGGGMAIWRRRA